MSRPRIPSQRGVIARLPLRSRRALSVLTACACVLGMGVAGTSSAAGTEVALTGSGGLEWSLLLREMNLHDAHAIPAIPAHGPLRILVLGDSHTAGDGFTQQLRVALQARFGDGGLGWLQPGKFKYYRSRQASIDSSGGWTLKNSLTDKDVGANYGLGGFLATANNAGATVRYGFNPRAGDTPSDQVATLFFRGAVPLAFADGRMLQPLPESAGAGTAGWRTVRFVLGTLPSTLEIQATGAMDLTGVAVDSLASGVVVDTIGTAGARIDLYTRWDRAGMAAQFAERDYALVILEYGTNDAFNDTFDRFHFDETVEETFAMLKEVAPRAALLIMEPPDAENRSAGCSVHVASKRPVKPVVPVSCLTAPPGNPRTCAWVSHPNLDATRESLERAARAHGAVTWRWDRLMGGTCGNHRWGLLDPPLALVDHVHLSTLGYELTGTALADALLQRYTGQFAARP